MVITDRNKYVSSLTILIGIIGAITTFSGLFTYFPQPYYVAGSLLLLMTAIHFRLYFFVALEIILLSGHSAILLGIGTMLQVALPILLCFQLLFFYFFSGQTKNLTIIIGIIGIALISIGFAIESQWVFLSGSLSIVIYAYYNIENSNKLSLIWLILNLMFAVTALYRIITNY